MKFAKFYPYDRDFHGTNPEFFAEKEAIDNLFLRLERFETDPETPIEQGKEINEICQKIIAEQKHLNAAQSPIIIATLSAVRIEIFLHLIRNSKIEKGELEQFILEKEYGQLIKDCGLSASVAKLLNEEQKKYISSDALDCAESSVKILTILLPHALEMKHRALQERLEEISVPDILTAASVVFSAGHSYNRIREVFHELWQITNLQPLLKVAACATLGKRCNYKGEVSDDARKLKIIFSDQFIKNVGTLGMSISDDVVLICLGDETGSHAATYYSNALLRGTIAHELHHFWEKCTHDSLSAVPYPEKTPLSEPFLEQLGAMLKEAKDITDEHSIEVDHAIRNNYSREKNREPYQVFRSFSFYPEDVDTRHAEIVVRISDALAGMVEPGKCSEEEAFARMRSSGLNRCVDFFFTEQESMNRAVELMDPKFRTTTTPDESLTIPAYAEYQSTKFHDAIRRKNLAALIHLIHEPTNPAAKDSFNETALELAIRHDEPQLVFAFAQSEKVLETLSKNLNLLRRVVFYLFDYAKSEDSEFHLEAIELFRRANIMSESSNLGRIFSEMREATLDQEFVKMIREKTTPSLLAEIESGTIPYFDKFGNNFKHYALAAERKDFLEAVEERYYLSNPRADFIPHDPIRSALLKNTPEFFVEIDFAFDPRRRMEMVFYFDSIIERIATKTTDREKGGEWLNIFKQIIQRHKIDPNENIGGGPKRLLDLLPEHFKKDVIDAFKTSSDPSSTTTTREMAKLSGEMEIIKT